MKYLVLMLLCAFPVFAQDITDGKAIVYVYSYSGATTLGQVRKPVFVDDKEVADMRPEHYFIVLLEPGRHTLHLKNKKLGGVDQEFKAGTTYYIRMDWRSGAKLSPSGFVSVTAENGAFDVKQLKPISKKNIKDVKSVILKLE